jgi:putative cardiolipin synthase
MKSPAATRWAVPTLVLLLAACAPLQPVDLPLETAPPPADGTLWTAIAAERPDAWSAEWHALLNEGPMALDWRLQAIDAATQSIDLQTFLWHVDAVGAAVIDHLLRAADRGVRIRILVDDSFLLGEDGQLMYLQQHSNIDYRIYNPYQRRSSNVATRQALNLAEFHRLDHRMHNKAMIVDGRVAIVGGRNLGDEYFGLHGEANFRDLELLVGGPIVGEVSAAFDRYWNDHWSIPIYQLTHVRPVAPDLQAMREVLDEHAHLHAELGEAERLAAWQALLDQALAGNARLLVDRPPEKNPAEANEAPVQVANELVRAFDEAREEIVIVSAYLIPTPSLDGALQRAIARGVRVRILTNSIGSNNHLTAHSAYRNHIDALLGFGVELHEVRTDAEDRDLYMLSPTERKALALHAKALVIDHDRVFIGSANLDPRSLRINTELGLLVHSEALNAQLRASLEPDFDESNAWRLELDDSGRVTWVSGDAVLTAQPAESFMQRVEDWFFAQLPLEEEL